MSCLIGVSKESYRGYFYIPSIGENYLFTNIRVLWGENHRTTMESGWEAEHLNGMWTLLKKDEDWTPMYPADVPRTGES